MATDDEIDAAAARAVELSRDKHHNGELGNRHRMKFDATISLGHLLTVSALCIAGFGTYIQFHDRQEKFDGRLKFVEDGVLKNTSIIEKLADNQNSLVRTQDRLTIIIEQQNKKP